MTCLIYRKGWNSSMFWLVYLQLHKGPSINYVVSVGESSMFWLVYPHHANKALNLHGTFIKKFSKKYYLSRLYDIPNEKKKKLSRCRPKLHSISTNTSLPISYFKKEHYSSPICLPSSLFLWWQRMWEVCCCYSVQEERGFGSWKLHRKCIESAQGTKIVVEEWCIRKSKMLKANSYYTGSFRNAAFGSWKKLC